MAVHSETFQFQAETKHLLDLMVNSLYTTKDIFLRELISNASDALDRLRFESLTHPDLIALTDKLEIRLETDRTQRTLTIHDSGIGMSRDEVVANIGTIAKSGTRELREKVKDAATDEQLTALIGQFGVGFYSCFMVADKVSLLTRRAGEETATLWESTGDGQYSVADAEKETHGTSITLQLKPFAPEAGIEDFTDKWILSRLVRRYSDFVSYPIIYQEARVARESKDEPEQPDAPTGELEETTLNSMKPIWARPQSEVSAQEYAEFYQHLFHDSNEPLLTIPAKAEGRIEYRAIAFVPSVAPYDLYYHAAEAGLHLYAKGVLVMEKCPDLLPRYLRFIRGVVDSSDIPLNISRQMLQQDLQLKQIRKWLTKKCLDSLQETAENDPEKYLRFWKQFGRALKEGIGSDYDNKDKLVSLLLFQSSHDPEALTKLQAYVERMKEEQTEIFYATGESRSVVENAPYLEAFKEQGYEVLYLVDPVDELLVQTLTEFEGRKLKSVNKGTVKLGKKEESEQLEKELKQKEEEASQLLQSIQRHLDQYIKEVRLTNRLTASPVCLVGAELDYSPQMERLLQMGSNGKPRQRRIMEINPQHEICVKLQERFRDKGDDEELAQYAELLLGYALLAEGSELPDPVKFNRHVTDLMTKTLSG